MDLAQYKAERGLTLTALARLLGRPASTVHGCLAGTRRPDWASIEDIARATAGAVTANDFHRPAGLAETQLPLAAQAEQLGIDAAKIAEQAVRAAIGAEKARRWAEENRAAIEAHIRYFEDNDTPLAEYRMF